jgi:hypothetical protein
VSRLRREAKEKLVLIVRSAPAGSIVPTEPVSHTEYLATPVPLTCPVPQGFTAATPVGVAYAKEAIARTQPNALKD